MVFVDGRPVQNHWTALASCRRRTPASDAMSKALKRRGFRFVGPTICYALMQACGLVNDHVIGCFRHAECAAASVSRLWPVRSSSSSCSCSSPSLVLMSGGIASAILGQSLERDAEARNEGSELLDLDD